MNNPDSTPIAAIATAPGRGGIGVVRISGSSLSAFTTRLLGQVLKPRHAHYIPFQDNEGQTIDVGLAIFFPAPHSYTGEDVLELQGHGGSAVLNRLLSHVLDVGKSERIRIAEPGEFSLRAFLNNKIDLTQAEAIADLIDATSTAAAKAAAGSLTGVFSEHVKQVSESMTALRVLVEATLDFPEEEIDFIEQYAVKSKLSVIQSQLNTLINQSQRSLALKDGLRVVLVGEPNVGKSSLLNALCGESVAIVTDIAGTTRDRIVQDLNLDGIPITLVDTAGLRQTDDVIENLGIERTWAEVHQADVLLHVFDAQTVLGNNAQVAPSLSPDLLNQLNASKSSKLLHLTLLNKSDLVAHTTLSNPHIVMVSAKTGLGLDVLKEKLLSAAGRSVGETSSWQGRARHIHALSIASDHIDVAFNHLSSQSLALDLVAEELRLAHHALGEITGVVYADDLLGKIFSEFCIGK